VLDTIADHAFTARRSRRTPWGDPALALATGLGWWVLLRDAGEAGSVQVGSIAVSTVAVAFWRLTPPGALVVGLGASLGLVAEGALTWPPVGPVLLCYLVAASDEQTEGAVRRSSVSVAAATSVYLVAVFLAPGRDLSSIAHPLLGFAVAWFAGERTRLRREQVQSLHERVLQTARSAAQETRIAVVEERNRIARDLHDSAGHALNVIAIRAGAAQLAADRARSLDALTDIAELARRTAADIDHIVGGLRDTDDRSRTPIGLASASTLIQEHCDAGLSVITAGDRTIPELSAAADQAAYRFLQEALTNAARHGAGHAIVEFSSSPTGFSITVTNSVAISRLPPRTTGHGLIGMRERAKMLGGAVKVSHPHRGFEVRLTLPTEPGR
jgi:signal transduction histidine kinase